MAARFLSLAGLLIYLILMGILAVDLVRARRREREEDRALRERLDAVSRPPDASRSEAVAARAR